jgi:hypothetical protein
MVLARPLNLPFKAHSFGIALIINAVSEFDRLLELVPDSL